MCLAAGPTRRPRGAPRDASRALDAGPFERRYGGAGVFQLPALRRSAARRRAAEAGDGGLRLAGDRRGARRQGTRGRRPGGGPQPLCCRGDAANRIAAADRGAPPRGDGDSGRWRRRRAGHRAADVGRPGGGAAGPLGRGVPLFLRRHRTHRRRREPRHGRALRRVALRQGRRRRLPERAVHEGAVPGVLRGAGVGRGVGPQELREEAVLRGVPAHRGDRPPRRRHAALRLHEAGGAAHARRLSSLRRGAAAPGGSGEDPLQPGGLPVPPQVGRAEARLPHDSGPRKRQVRAHGPDPPQYLHQRAHPPRPPLPHQGEPAGAPGGADHRRRGLPGVGGDGLWPSRST